MTTANKYKIQTRNQNNNLHTAWTTDGIGDQNEFELAAEARVCVRALRSYGDSWAEAEYRLLWGPHNDVYSAEMDGPSWQYAIDLQLARLGLSDASNGRSAMVCRIDDAGAVLVDVDDWNKPMAPEKLCRILEAIDAAQHLDDIREELAADLVVGEIDHNPMAAFDDE